MSREKHDLKGYVYLSVHCSTVYELRYGSKLNAHRQIKKIVIHIYNGILISIKKNEIIPEVFNAIFASQRYKERIKVPPRTSAS